MTVPGCTNDDANNYNPAATVDNGTCTYNGCLHNSCETDLLVPNGASCDTDADCVSPTVTCCDGTQVTDAAQCPTDYNGNATGCGSSPVCNGDITISDSDETTCQAQDGTLTVSIA